MTIDGYLRDLRRALPGDPLFRRRVLAEVEDHLRESAESVGEEEALRRMGAPHVLAAGFAEPATTRAARSAAAIIGGCLGGFVLAYGVSENTLPPAPWPSADAAPAFLRWTTTGAGWAFALAAALAGAAVLLALLRRASVALAASCACALVLAVACALALAASVRRATLYDELGVAGRWSAIETTAGAVYIVSLAAVALVAAGWATRVWLTAQRASRSYGFRR